MSPQRRKKEFQSLEDRLFNFHSRDLFRVSSAAEGGFRCPICLRSYLKGDLKSEKLTLEHVIPKKLGGKVYTLSCKDCNNRHGSELDSHLFNMIKFYDCSRGQLPFHGTFEVGDHKVRSEIVWGKDKTIAVTAKTKANNPTTVKAATLALGSGLNKMKINLSLEYNVDRAKLAIIKCAYLAAFRAGGYRYILSPSFQKFRDSLMDVQSCLGLYDSLVVKLSEIPLQKKPLLFVDLSKSVFPQSMLVVLRLRSKYNEYYYAAFLPPPGSSFEDLAEKFQDFTTRKGTAHTLDLIFKSSAA